MTNICLNVFASVSPHFNPSETYRWSGIVKFVEFDLVEMVRFVPKSPLQALEIVTLRHFYVITIQENANMTLFRKNIL
jgi:hypothetical protein